MIERAPGQDRWGDYPRPRIPPRPVLSVRSLGIGKLGKGYRSAFDSVDTRRLTSGRVSIAWALRCLGLVAGDEVLVPAFNCPSVVSPIEWAGARPVYYRVNRDLSVDFADVAQKVTNRSRALLVIHYFGFPQDMDAVMRIGRELDIAVVEDCAHSVFSTYNGVPVGSRGDFAIASAMKIYAATDGGYVVSRRGALPQPAKGARGFELKSLVDAFEMATSFGRLGMLRHLTWTKNLLRFGPKRPEVARPPSAFAIPESSEGGSEFEPDWIDVRMSVISQSLSGLSSRRRIVETRRRHYLALHQALGSLPGSNPVFDALPDGVVPYAYPLEVTDEQSVFPKLKHAGVPIFRWELANGEACETSAWYSRHLLQFPCHQELTNSEVDWMIDQIRRALGA